MGRGSYTRTDHMISDIGIAMVTKGLFISVVYSFYTCSIMYTKSKAIEFLHFQLHYDSVGREISTL